MTYESKETRKLVMISIGKDHHRIEQVQQQLTIMDPRGHNPP